MIQRSLSILLGLAGLFPFGVFSVGLLWSRSIIYAVAALVSLSSIAFLVRIAFGAFNRKEGAAAWILTILNWTSFVVFYVWSIWDGWGNGHRINAPIGLIALVVIAWIVALVMGTRYFLTTSSKGNSAEAA